VLHAATSTGRVQIPGNDRDVGIEIIGWRLAGPEEGGPACELNRYFQGKCPRSK
jgi:hypothetical protein